MAPPLNVDSGVEILSDVASVTVSSFFLFDGCSISMMASSLPAVDCDSLLVVFDPEEGLPRPAWSAGEGTTSPLVRGRAPGVPVAAVFVDD